MTETTKKTTNATKKDVAAAQAAQNIPAEIKKPLSKFGKQETFKGPDGTSYTLQFPGTRAAQDMLDGSKNRFGNVVSSALYEELWKDVFVEPKGINWDYWDEHDGYSEVMAQAESFLASLLN
ncbi:hypothetical protein [Listeria ilorinensis]|uniref:hypothetical protein n=1 Tax=Listeria ilorinensis TaxID=2867439 RepID=UPI001EF40855|nr:hypothetical protein [Listeria ilorinensis]